MKNKSTYSLLVGSEEKKRSILEIALYAAFALSVLVTVWQFARQPVSLPKEDAWRGPSVAVQGVSLNGS